jgi:phosphotransferase system HPr-like phosphotransfer protein
MTMDLLRAKQLNRVVTLAPPNLRNPLADIPAYNFRQIYIASPAGHHGRPSFAAALSCLKWKSLIVLTALGRLAGLKRLMRINGRSFARNAAAPARLRIRIATQSPHGLNALRLPGI